MKAGDGQAAFRPVVLETKLVVPPVRAEHVARGELLRLLSDSTARALTVLTGPPGFGKTTLLAEWAAGGDAPPVAWLGLDDDDNDPARFFTYLVAALRTVEPELGARAVTAHATPGAGLVDVVLPLLLNDLAVRDRRIVLVLDDYHVITEPEIHESLSSLVERLPGTVHLMLATREDPPLPLARLRARGMLAEIRADALRFTDDEAARFLNDVLGVDLSPQDVGRLQVRTEGWPAALYLAALSLRGRPDRSALIDAFAGDDRYLVDYLTEEVLARQSSELRTFLVRTSILRRLCGPLCDAVVERDDSTLVLDELERSNLLLLRLDSRREWYRYHPLFAEVLRTELARTDPDLLPRLHSRACRWHRDAGLVVDAAHHATESGDVDAAVELVARNYSVFLGQGQLATVSHWLDALPAGVVAGDWLLSFAAAMVTAHSGRLAEAERWLELAQRAPESGREARARSATVAALDAYVRLLGGDVQGSIAAARRALQAERPAETGWALAPQLVLGAALWWAGQLAEAESTLDEVVQLSRAAALPATTVFGLGMLAAAAFDGGDRERASGLAQQAVELTGRAALEEHPFTAMGRVVHGRALAERGEPLVAAEEIERGIALAQRVRAWHIGAYGLLALAEVRRLERDVAGARRSLHRARDLLESLPAPGPGLARLEASEKLLRLRAARRPEAGGAPFWELSERELAVLRLLAGTLTQREIAAELYVSFNTVKTHMRAIFRKLGVASRAAAVERANELGLL